jgi:microcystin degradation protein MlrC
MIASYAPGLFLEATKVIMDQQLHHRLQVMSELHRLSNQYTSWYNEWEHVLHSDQTSTRNKPSPALSDGLQHADILTRYYSQMALVHQFMFALSPHQSTIVAEAARAAANEVTRIAEGLGVNSIAKIRVRIAMHIATSIQTVSEVWKQAAYSIGPSATIEPTEFSRWCSVIGRSDGNPMSCVLLSARIQS